MKCKIIESVGSHYDLQREIEKFLADHTLVTISYATTKHGYTTYYSALIIYN